MGAIDHSAVRRDTERLLELVRQGDTAAPLPEQPLPGVRYTETASADGLRGELTYTIANDPSPQVTNSHTEPRHVAFAEAARAFGVTVWKYEHDRRHASLLELTLLLSAEGDAASVRGFFRAAVAILRG